MLSITKKYYDVFMCYKLKGQVIQNRFTESWSEGINFSLNMKDFTKQVSSVGKLN